MRAPRTTRGRAQECKSEGMTRNRKKIFKEYEALVSTARERERERERKRERERERESEKTSTSYELAPYVRGQSLRVWNQQYIVRGAVILSDILL